MSKLKAKNASGVWTALEIVGTQGPQGVAGADGVAATIAVGTVTTGEAGSSATVTNTGTSSAAVFNFTIPKGDTGTSGATTQIADPIGSGNAITSMTVSGGTITPNLGRTFLTSADIEDKADKSTTTTAGTYKQVTVTSQGIVSGGANPTTLAGFGITDAYTKTEVDTKVSSVLRYKGSCTYAELTAKTDMEVGDTWNVTDAHDNIPAGTNHAWNGESWYPLGGTVDLSSYVPNTRTVNGHALSANVTVSASDVGLGNVDNTSDANKPISSATQTALDGKQATLVSGTNIKTVNSNSLLGSGNIQVGTVEVSASEPTDTNVSYWVNTADTTGDIVQVTGTSTTNVMSQNACTNNFQLKLPTTTTAGKVLKSTTTSGTVQWGDVESNVDDVQVNGTSVVTSKIANIDISGKADKVSLTAGTAGTSSATSGSTLSVPYVTMNAQGLVTDYGTHTHTISGFSTTDTKNTAGLTNTTSKIYLCGGTAQTDGLQTYSNSSCYASGGYLYSGSTKVSVEGHTHSYLSTSGGTVYGALTVTGALKGATVQATSDKRLKADIEDVNYTLDNISAKKYTLNSDGLKHIGLIAQEVETNIPEAVSKDKDGYLSLDYNAIVAVLVNEVNTLKARLNKAGIE